ncbi:MAG TPA: translational GTPase TypA [Chloroflexota bacterium]|nr:translational GTPase TypA [Chloroflexota bacterium]
MDRAMPAQRALRNVCIIAHVDHGKTTLVDGMLKQSHIFRANQDVGELILDSNDLEREKGITILAKNTAVTYHGVKINIIDTPGHADFSGEVERVMNMADGCLLLVDAAEGPMPQTRYVLRKAFEAGLRPIVVVNKVDRTNARPAEVLHLTQDLFLELATDAEQLDFPVLYAIGRDGRAGHAPDALADDLTPLFDTILEHVPPPGGDPEAPFQLMVASLDYDPHLGRIALGRVGRGGVGPGDTVLRLGRDAQERYRVSQVFVSEGLKRVPVERALAGEIVAICGVAEAQIGDTLADPAVPEALDRLTIDEPTVRMTFGVNTSPFAGREGKWCTSRQLRARLFRELETNVALRVAETDSPDVFLVSGRGELHLAILVETMRREGYEFQVSRPEVITHEENGRQVEPVEDLVIDTTEEYVGAVNELLGKRQARLQNMHNDGRGNVRLEFRIPTRGLIGFRQLFLTATRGNGIMASRLVGYEPWAGDINSTRNGALVAWETGTAVTYGLANAQERGITFIEPQTKVYEGMIVGLHSREDDLTVNVCKEKKQTNMRASTAEIAIRLTPPMKLSLEQALDLIADDELVEITPAGFRLRKRLLSLEERRKAAQQRRVPAGAR